MNTPAAYACAKVVVPSLPPPGQGRPSMRKRLQQLGKAAGAGLGAEAATSEDVVRRQGLEPRTRRLRVCCSAN
jgi:hypothetical protein